MGDWQGRLLWVSTAVTAVVAIALFAHFRGSDPPRDREPAATILAPTPDIGHHDDEGLLPFDIGAELLGSGTDGASEDVRLRERLCGPDKLPGGDTWVKDTTCSFFVAATTLDELNIRYTQGAESYPVFDAAAVDEPVIVDGIFYARDRLDVAGDFEVVPTGVETLDPRFEIARVRLGIG